MTPNQMTKTKSGLHAIPDIFKKTQELYLNMKLPWVIGYSGGKDSTTALQIVWQAIAKLPVEQRTHKIYVISTDTLVETPVIVDHVDETLKRINTTAQELEMPFEAHKLSPILDDTFWVNLLGRGYPAPNNNFRWCTERLKINPSNRFILDTVAEHGEVILVLGSRRGESVTRDQVLNMHKVSGYDELARHGQLPGAWVYMPIEHFTVNDIWKYLLQVQSPWGSDNRQLSSLYQSAQDGECPLVVDSSTSSCGSSRFGCWVCTVVTKDKSMQAMIESGENWMTPLLGFRDRLAATQDPEVKPDQREIKGRDGTVKISSTGKIRYRTFTLDYSKTLLRDLLQTQKAVQKSEPEFLLIGRDELKEIRRIWMMERQDWGDSLPQIHEEETGEQWVWERYDVFAPGRLEADAMGKIAEEYDVPASLMQKLLDAEWQNYGMKRRANIHKRIEKIFREDWRETGEILQTAEQIRLEAEQLALLDEESMA